MFRFRNLARVCGQISPLRKTSLSAGDPVQNYPGKTCSKASGKEEKSEPLMDIKCKNVVFTSGISGIGFATAHQLICDGAQHVFISGNDLKEGECAVEKLQKKHGEDKVSYIPGDVRDDHHLKNLFEQCREKYEHVDILINDAAILKDRYWKHTVDINMAGVLRPCLLAMSYMGKNECGRGGVIVNLSSIYGMQPLPGAPVYSAAKYGVIGITLNLGDKFHFCNSGVRVVALCPGVTETAHIKDVAHKQYKEEWGEDVQEEFESADKQPPEIVAKAISYVVKMAPSATVWTVEDHKLFHAEIPDRKTYSEMMAEMK